jgi:hypothetical protein
LQSSSAAFFEFFAASAKARIIYGRQLTYGYRSVFRNQPVESFVGHPLALDPESGKKGFLGITQIDREARRPLNFSAILFDDRNAFGLLSKDPPG